MLVFWGLQRQTLLECARKPRAVQPVHKHRICHYHVVPVAQPSLQNGSLWSVQCVWWRDDGGGGRLTHSCTYSHTHSLTLSHILRRTYTVVHVHKQLKANLFTFSLLCVSMGWGHLFCVPRPSCSTNWERMNERTRIRSFRGPERAWTLKWLVPDVDLRVPNDGTKLPPRKMAKKSFHLCSNLTVWVVHKYTRAWSITKGIEFRHLPALKRAPKRVTSFTSTYSIPLRVVIYR